MNGVWMRVVVNLDKENCCVLEVPREVQAMLMGAIVEYVLMVGGEEPSCEGCQMRDSCRFAWRKYRGDEVIEKCVAPGLRDGRFEFAVAVEPEPCEVRGVQ